MFISPPRNTFRYTFSWLIVAALFLVPQLMWAAYDYSQTRQVGPGLAFFTVISGIFVAYAWWWTKTRVTLHDEGISYKSPFREKDLRWDEITETRYGQQPLNAGAHFGLIGWLIAAMARGNNKMIRSFELIGPHKIVLNSNIRKKSCGSPWRPSTRGCGKTPSGSSTPAERSPSERFRCLPAASSGNRRSQFPTPRS